MNSDREARADKRLEVGYYWEREHCTKKYQYLDATQRNARIMELTGWGSRRTADRPTNQISEVVALVKARFISPAQRLCGSWVEVFRAVEWGVHPGLSAQRRKSLIF